MRIELSHPYKSISTLKTSEELPDFAILIGRNGAGKTQLLEALKEGHAAVPGIRVDDIELYDMVSFRPPNTTPADRNASQFAQLTADAYLLSPSGGQPPIEAARAIFDRFASDIERDSGTEARGAFEDSLRQELQRTQDFTVFAVDHRESPYKETLYAQVLAPLNRPNAGRQGGGHRTSPATASTGTRRPWSPRP